MKNLHQIQNNFPKMDRFMKSTLWSTIRHGNRVRWTGVHFERFRAIDDTWIRMYFIPDYYYYRAWLNNNKPMDFLDRIER